MNEIPVTERTKVRRLAERGRYERQEVYDIIDEALVSHVGVVEDGRPLVLPTLHVRRGDLLYIHGSPANALLRAARDRSDVCVAITILDGLVLARSGFHHSVNYRSAVVFGRADEVNDLEEKQAALDAIVDHVAPGRLPFLRPMTEKDIKGTLVLSVPLEEASAKVRTGMPKDEPEDYDLPIWAGVLPVGVQRYQPLSDPKNLPGVTVPQHVLDWRNKQTN